jgi:hypothetical protein
VWTDAAAGVYVRHVAAASLASARAARGELDAAEAILSQGHELTVAAGVPSELSLFATPFLRLMSGTLPKGVVAPSDSSTSGRDALASGLDALAHGDLASARASRQVARTHEEHLGPADLELLAVLEAWVAAHEARWDTVIGLARPAAVSPRVEVGGLMVKAAARWLVANAFEAGGQPDSAAHYYTAALSPLRIQAPGVVLRGLSFPFIHQRLVMLYVGMGRLEEAREHWEVFRRTFTRPDPEVRHLIDEARSALTSAEAMARPGTS